MKFEGSSTFCEIHFVDFGIFLLSFCWYKALKLVLQNISVLSPICLLWYCNSLLSWNSMHKPVLFLFYSFTVTIMILVLYPSKRFFSSFRHYSLASIQRSWPY